MKMAWRDSGFVPRTQKRRIASSLPQALSAHRPGIGPITPLLHIASEPPNTGPALSFPQSINKKSRPMFSTGPTPAELDVTGRG